MHVKYLIYISILKSPNLMKNYINFEKLVIFFFTWAGVPPRPVLLLPPLAVPVVHVMFL